MYSLTAKYNLRCGHAARYLILMYAPSKDNIMRMRPTYGMLLQLVCRALNEDSQTILSQIRRTWHDQSKSPVTYGEKARNAMGTATVLKYV